MVLDQYSTNNHDPDEVVPVILEGDERFDSPGSRFQFIVLAEGVELDSDDVRIAMAECIEIFRERHELEDFQAMIEYSAIESLLQEKEDQRALYSKQVNSVNAKINLRKTHHGPYRSRGWPKVLEPDSIDDKEQLIRQDGTIHIRMLPYHMNGTWSRLTEEEWTALFRDVELLEDVTRLEVGLAKKGNGRLDEEELKGLLGSDVPRLGFELRWYPNGSLTMRLSDTDRQIREATLKDISPDTFIVREKHTRKNLQQFSEARVFSPDDQDPLNPSIGAFEMPGELIRTAIKKSVLKDLRLPETVNDVSRQGGVEAHLQATRDFKGKILNRLHNPLVDDPTKYAYVLTDSTKKLDMLVYLLGEAYVLNSSIANEDKIENIRNLIGEVVDELVTHKFMMRRGIEARRVLKKDNPQLIVNTGYPKEDLERWAEYKGTTQIVSLNEFAEGKYDEYGIVRLGYSSGEIAFNADSRRKYRNTAHSENRHRQF